MDPSKKKGKTLHGGIEKEGRVYSHDARAVIKCYPRDGRADYQYYPNGSRANLQ